MAKYVRIRDLREDRDKTQQQLADELGMYKTTYARYEQGEREPPFAFMIQLAQYYGVSLDYLAGLTDPVKPPTENNLP
ncbi:helix-turn-helix transcriptional regulator [uncultured Anaerotruncus sp.]|uniref:helix-turn-helix domain-containing protein n=1 Tax=uncultured Anaerotruncus sp. TaxID=905011 RepID=UPI00280A7824|nr:helix-turn-helix transcriptional regulator [uncultured Anaerotruncus sp.]